MSYQVLARKWRPQTFAAVVGQQHVLQALSNALTHQRLHHAYLLTGTRGVGKTTIARILAKSLNCEQGISATPCGVCPTCQEIDEGRHVDLIEIDAASRTKVEDTRELLDNVQYRPTRGRYKVYLIDEVHMLSRHSFNALLKTLEEPPEHVKFLLATTDPEKLPVTVLSRCLQFHLRALTRDEIAAQLEHVLSSEGLNYDAQAVRLLARAARGSMRDALSLTDQAIAQGNQAVELESVRNMLGHIEGRRVVHLLAQLHSGDSQAVLESLRDIQNRVPDIAVVLPELQNLLHQVALYQVSPAIADSDLFGEQNALQRLADALPPEVVQVYYRIVLEGRRELPHAVDAFSAVEMTLLRLLAFRPASNDDFKASDFATEVAANPIPKQAEATPEPEPMPQPAAVSVKTAAPEPMPKPTPQAEQQPQHEDETAELQLAAAQESIVDQAEAQREPAGIADLIATRESLRAKKKAAEIDEWSAWVDQIETSGRVRQVLLNSVLIQTNRNYQLQVASEHRVLCSEAVVAEIEHLLRPRLGDNTFTVEFGQPGRTPFLLQQALDERRQQEALESVQNDPRVTALRQRFNAELDVASVAPRD